MMNNKLWQRWLIALALALGLGVVWGFLAVLGGSVVFGLWPNEKKSIQYVQVTVDGEPLIHTSIGGNYLHAELRNLAGEIVDPDSVQLLTGAETALPFQTPGVIELPITWSERLAGTGDYARPPIEWMMIRDAKPLGHAYLAGFDPITKLRVGYLGSLGFRQSVPPVSEQFDMGNYRLTRGERLRFAGSERIAFGSRSHQYSSPTHSQKHILAPGVVFFLDAKGSIYEINLRTHEVKVLAELSEASSIAATLQPLPKTADGNGEEDGQDDMPTGGYLQLDLRATNFTSPSNSVFTLAQHFHPTAAFPTLEKTKRRKLTHRLVARCVDKLVVLNPFDGTWRDFPLPESLRSTGFSVRPLSEDKIFLEVNRGYWKHGSTFDLIQLNSSGQITHTETVQLSSFVPEDPRVTSLSLAAVGPSPVAWFAGIAVAGAGEKLQHHRANSYPNALLATLNESWPGLLITVFATLIATWLVFRQQKKYVRPDTRLWCLTTLATGVPGLLAYLALHCRPPTETCSECGKQTPRNRDACPHCEKPFAPPALLGTEILT